MSIMTEIIRRIELGGEGVMSEILSDLIKDHEPKKERMIAEYERYKALKSGVPIFNRKFDDPNKINNKINNPFDVDIIDVKVGYMLGNPIIYGLNENIYSKKTKDVVTGQEVQEVDKNKLEIDKKLIDDFNMANNIEDLDGETLKMASICSYGVRLLYVDKNAEVRVIGLDPWECIFVKDGSIITETQYAMRYYIITDGGDKKYYVEWYDQDNIYYYITSKGIGEYRADEKYRFIPYEKDGKYSMPHLFGEVPLIRFENNKELQGDVEKVLALIDAYDRTTSDVSSEIEQFRLAYLAFYGMAPDEETIALAKRTGAYGLPDVDARVEFITKEMDDSTIEHHLDRLEENIYKFAKSVNFSDEAFGGNVSGIAMKFKMFGLESKCIISERKYTAGLRRMYRILAGIWSTKGSMIDYKAITFVWTRNFPLNLLDESQTTKNLKGTISEKTRLGLLSFIDDVDGEIQEMEKDSKASGFVDLDNTGFGEDNTNFGRGGNDENNE